MREVKARIRRMGALLKVDGGECMITDGKFVYLQTIVLLAGKEIGLHRAVHGLQLISHVKKYL